MNSDLDDYLAGATFMEIAHQRNVAVSDVVSGIHTQLDAARTKQSGWTFRDGRGLTTEVTFTGVSLDLVRWLFGDIPDLRRPRMKYRARRRHRGYTRTGRRR